MNYTVPDKLITTVLPKDYIMASSEGEAISLACGEWFATGNVANVYISADGFMNALNAITSLVIPEGIPINLFISIGRYEKQHYVATKLVPKIIDAIKTLHESETIHYEFITRK